MRHLSTGFLTLLLSICILAQPGCVEVVGQRITIFHNQDQDRLLLLIHYDGIHDDASRQYGGGGPSQIREAAEHGVFYFHDWPWIVSMKEIAEELESGEHPPELTMFLRTTVSQLKIHSLGTYRDMDGRIGAVQGVELSKVSTFFEQANRALNRQIRDEEPGGEKDWEHTLERFRDAAKREHQWLRLDGHSIVVQIPVHPQEWTRGKGQALFDAARWIVKDGFDSDNEISKELISAIMALISGPISLTDDGDSVTVRLGLRNSPSTFRLLVEPEYEDSLEAVLQECVPEKIDTKLVTRLLETATPKSDRWVEAITQWGPPEDKVRAVLAVAEDEKRREAALAWLKNWGTRWNREQRLPPAPVAGPADVAPTDAPGEGDDAALEKWREWYRSAVSFPVKPREKGPKD